MDYCLSVISSKFTFTLNSKETLSDLDADSCSRIYDLTPHFFTCLWDTIKKDLLQAFGQGMIHLIPKSGGSANDISKWRPVTLLNIVYKLLAKIVARHLTPLLPQLIHPSQKGFVRNRSILDNLFSFWEAVALAKRTNKVAVVLLDFEKAYDRVCWNFLESVMGKLGFQET